MTDEDLLDLDPPEEDEMDPEDRDGLAVDPDDPVDPDPDAEAQEGHVEDEE